MCESIPASPDAEGERGHRHIETTRLTPWGKRAQQLAQTWLQDELVVDDVGRLNFQSEPQSFHHISWPKAYVLCPGFSQQPGSHQHHGWRTKCNLVKCASKAVSLAKVAVHSWSGTIQVYTTEQRYPSVPAPSRKKGEISTQRLLYKERNRLTGL